MPDDRAELPPDVEPRFQALAASVAADTWQQLIAATSDRILRRLAAVGAIAEPDPQTLLAARQTVGEVLVELTNVTLTCLAEAGCAPSRASEGP